MKSSQQIAVAGALALLLGGTAAWSQTTVTGVRTLDDRIDDITDDVDQDLARANDDYRFGSPDMRQGLTGSASLGYSGKTGNNDSQELSFGARLTSVQGPYVQTFGAAIDYAESDGGSTKEDLFAIYDVSYYLNDRFYVFGLGRAQFDGLADTAGEVKTDAFLVVGPGYRIVNTPDFAWRLQAGLGVSYLENGLNESDTELGVLASSRVFYKFTDTVFATNDTDILTSDAGLRVSNDLGVNFRVTDSFSTRVSYLTDYNDSRKIRTDNRLGVSLVYGF